MSFEQIIFYLFAAILVFAGLRVITARQSGACRDVPGAGVLHQCGTVAVAGSGVPGNYAGAGYVGAVMVLFLFVVMMLDINLVPLREGFTRYLPLAGPWRWPSSWSCI